MVKLTCQRLSSGDLWLDGNIDIRWLNSHLTSRPTKSRTHENFSVVRMIIVFQDFQIHFQLTRKNTTNKWRLIFFRAKRLNDEKELYRDHHFNFFKLLSCITFSNLHSNNLSYYIYSHLTKK